MKSTRKTPHYKNDWRNCKSVTPKSEDISAAVRALASGHVIAYPTETVYGLGVDPFHTTALDRLLALKGRDAAKGMILLVDGVAGVEALVTEIPAVARGLMARFWPGPLTLILPARPELPVALTGGRATVAIRHSPGPVVTALLHRWRRPLVSTSANRTGQPVFPDAEAIRSAWPPDQVPIVLNGPVAPHGLPSTMVQVAPDGQLTLLREGAIKRQTFGRWLDKE
jgi:L-threonylcarbamoyladenylate synthase